MAEPRPDPAWRRFAAWLLGTLGAGGALMAAALLLLDPYGVSPVGLAKPRPLMDANQRWMYPQLVRHGGHDSLVIGTSTSRLLRPAELDAAFGGRFANLALNAGLAAEQLRVLEAFRRANGPPRTLLVGLDAVWCDPGATPEGETFRGWPTWLWQGEGWGAVARTLNPRSLEIAARQLGLWLGVQRPRFDADGFGDFTGGEAGWNLERARWHIWGGGPPGIRPEEPPADPSPAEVAGWRFPALEWLDAALGGLPPGATRTLLVFMPVHVAAQPRPGSLAERREAACKAHAAEVAARHGALFQDHRIASPVTTDDALWWDSQHWRIGLGPRLIAEMASALGARQASAGR
ncbi:MAG: hypothetical protein MUF65_00860 [Rubritepida sp.]|jgi:hypothetical protein|nr:hypothetical protein [Rubritepida sp.]